LGREARARRARLSGARKDAAAEERGGLSLSARELRLSLTVKTSSCGISPSVSLIV
jgi:hypothetical protein